MVFSHEYFDPCNNHFRYVYDDLDFANTQYVTDENIDEENTTTSEKFNLFGLDINIDDVIILAMMFFIFQNEEDCDFITLIALGLLLLSND